MKTQYQKRPPKPPKLVPHPNLQAIWLEVEAARKVLHDIEGRWNLEATRLVSEKLQTSHEVGTLEFAGWECSQSPTVHCVYDTESEFMQGYCIFCEEDRERK